MMRRKSDEFRRGMLRAAELAELFADENIRMANDTVLADPILNHANRANIKNRAQLEAASVIADDLAMQGADYASRYHAGTDIAAMIRKEADV